jgi:hypothetical protein
MAQMARPPSSLPQLGAEVDVAAWLSKALHVLPLNTVEASPPVALRAAHSTRPPPSEAQLTAEASDPFTLTSTLHAVPLNVVATMPPFDARTAQTTWPLPSFTQLGAELIAPASFFHPAHVEPLNWFTRSVLVKPLAAHTACPPLVAAQDTSEFTVVDPMDTNEPHAAMAGYAWTSSNSKIRETAKRIFMFEFSSVDNFES